MTTPLTSYCKKCRQDVPVASFCPHCRSKLAPNTVRLAWCVDHHPVRDWMCWNAVMRLLLPVMGATLLLVILLEAVMGGLDGIASRFDSGHLIRGKPGIHALAEIEIHGRQFIAEGSLAAGIPVFYKVKNGNGFTHWSLAEDIVSFCCSLQE